jgi:hypothetical protein
MLIVVWLRPELIEQLVNLSLLLALWWLCMQMVQAAIGRRR